VSRLEVVASAIGRLTNSSHMLHDPTTGAAAVQAFQQRALLVRAAVGRRRTRPSRATTWPGRSGVSVPAARSTGRGW
jgi:hypothetical protein